MILIHGEEIPLLKSKIRSFFQDYKFMGEHGNVIFTFLYSSITQGRGRFNVSRNCVFF
jgi:hypothetical protein